MSSRGWHGEESSVFYPVSYIVLYPIVKSKDIVCSRYTTCRNHMSFTTLLSCWRWWTAYQWYTKEEMVCGATATGHLLHSISLAYISGKLHRILYTHSMHDTHAKSAHLPAARESRESRESRGLSVAIQPSSRRGQLRRKVPTGERQTARGGGEDNQSTH